MMQRFLIATTLILAAAPVAAQSEPVRDPAPVRQTPFPDVPQDHWAFDAVEQLRQKGILRGYPSGKALAATKQTTKGKASPALRGKTRRSVRR